TVREVSAKNTKHQVPCELQEAFGYPSEYPVVERCIALFLKHEGREVLCFIMYTFEYGHACAPPNQRRAYISFLDTVPYI
ncbi:unnamed protein product, partial [Scytosiphon promiscuus]